MKQQWKGTAYLPKNLHFSPVQSFGGKENTFLSAKSFHTWRKIYFVKAADFHPNLHTCLSLFEKQLIRLRKEA
jgi:hypothetical protein